MLPKPKTLQVHRHGANLSVDVDKTKINCPFEVWNSHSSSFFFHLPRYNASLPARDIALKNTFQFFWEENIIRAALNGPSIEIWSLVTLRPNNQSERPETSLGFA
jgi:hypothetical protein